MSNFWNQDSSNEASFRDGPEEGDELHIPEPVPAPTPRAQRKEVASVQELIEEVQNEEDDDDYSTILADANLRIDQGTLYKMIMNSSLFDQMDVDQRAIDNVQREIRKFAKERMEFMLGMRQEAVKEIAVSSQFNDLEVSVLKKLASAATKGATETKEAQVKQVTTPKAPVKSNTLTPISSKPVAQPKTQAPLAKKTPPQPIKRQSKPPTTIEEAIRSDDGYKPLDKPIEKMTEDEIIQRNKDSAIRQSMMRAAKSSTSLPVPSVDQMNTINAMRAAEATNDPGLSRLVSMVKNRS